MQQVVIMMRPLMDHLQQTDSSVHRVSLDLAEVKAEVDRTNKYLAILRQVQLLRLFSFRFLAILKVLGMLFLPNFFFLCNLCQTFFGQTFFFFFLHFLYVKPSHFRFQLRFAPRVWVCRTRANASSNGAWNPTPGAICPQCGLGEKQHETGPL